MNTCHLIVQLVKESRRKGKDVMECPFQLQEEEPGTRTEYDYTSTPALFTTGRLTTIQNL